MIYYNIFLAGLQMMSIHQLLCLALVSPTPLVKLPLLMYITVQRVLAVLQTIAVQRTLAVQRATAVNQALAVHLAQVMKLPLVGLVLLAI